jgi:hypothetical protein
MIPPLGLGDQLVSFCLHTYDFPYCVWCDRTKAREYAIKLRKCYVKVIVLVGYNLPANDHELSGASELGVPDPTSLGRLRVTGNGQ